MYQFTVYFIYCRRFWKAKDKWYPTWNNGKGEDHAMKVDYVRLYSAATVWNGADEYYIGNDGLVLWHIMCDFVGHDITTLPLMPEHCGGACLNDTRCTHFSHNSESCHLKSAPKDVKRQPSKSGVFNQTCGIIPSRVSLTLSGTNSASSETNFARLTICIIVLFYACF